MYTKVQGKGDICLLYFINLKDFFRVKAKVTFVYFCQISDEICILLVNRELVLWDEPNVRLGLVRLGLVRVRLGLVRLGLVWLG